MAATSLIQLFICIHAEYARLKTPSILRACRITNQKFLYILVFLAALLRGLYFAYPVIYISLESVCFDFRLAKQLCHFQIKTGIDRRMVVQSSERLLSGSVDRSFIDCVLLGGGKENEGCISLETRNLLSVQLTDKVAIRKNRFFFSENGILYKTFHNRLGLDILFLAVIRYSTCVTFKRGHPSCPSPFWAFWPSTSSRTVY